MASDIFILPIDELSIGDDLGVVIKSKSIFDCHQLELVPAPITKDEIDQKKFHLQLIGKNCVKGNLKEVSYQQSSLKDSVYGFVKRSGDVWEITFGEDSQQFVNVEF